MSTREIFCQICRHPVPGHEPNCPVLTQEPQPGMLPPELAQAMAEGQQQIDGQLSAWGMTEFVGGPLDGSNPVHPMANCILTVQGHPEGHYEMFGPWYPPLADGRYHWILQAQKAAPPP